MITIMVFTIVEYVRLKFSDFISDSIPLVIAYSRHTNRER